MTHANNYGAYSPSLQSKPLASFSKVKTYECQRNEFPNSVLNNGTDGERKRTFKNRTHGSAQFPSNHFFGNFNGVTQMRVISSSNLDVFIHCHSPAIEPPMSTCKFNVAGLVNFKFSSTEDNSVLNDVSVEVGERTTFYLYAE